MQSINPAIAKKIYGLLTYLSYAKTEFEIVADEISDCRLKTALNGLSEESDLYFNELCLQLKMLGLQYQTPEALPNIEAVNQERGPAIKQKENELQQICNNSEQMISNAYVDILKDHFPFPAIREIMIYQLNTLKSAFMKINLLNSTRFLQATAFL